MSRQSSFLGAGLGREQEERKISRAEHCGCASRALLIRQFMFVDASDKHLGGHGPQSTLHTDQPTGRLIPPSPTRLSGFSQSSYNVKYRRSVSGYSSPSRNDLHPLLHQTFCPFPALFQFPHQFPNYIDQRPGTQPSRTLHSDPHHLTGETIDCLILLGSWLKSSAALVTGSTTTDGGVRHRLF